MSGRIQILSVALSVFLCLSINAQSKNNVYAAWDDWDDWRFEFSYNRPFIELNYGFGKPAHDKFNGNFSEIGAIELKLGYLKENTSIYSSLDKRKESYVFASKIATDLSTADLNNTEFECTLWRFGMATRNTLGYSGGSVAVLPYNQSGFVWSQLTAPESRYPVIPHDQIFELLLPNEASDYKIIERYRDSFRFGTVAEGGIRVEFLNTVSINAGYEASVVFPRHLFWKHAGSYIIEKAGQGALTYFIDEITDSSPIAGPLVNFILQNGYAYAFHILKKKDMNWPFQTEAPLTYETFKFGVTFTF